MVSYSQIYLIFLALSSCVEFVSGIRCLSCTNVIQPRHCWFVRTCPDDHKCGVIQYKTISGDTRYDVDCVTDQVCGTTNYRPHHQGHNHEGVTMVTCNECCQGDLCNHGGCGQPGYPAARGPICFDCVQETHPSKCERINVCRQDEMCIVEKEEEFGDVIYTSRCVPKYECLTVERTTVAGNHGGHGSGDQVLIGRRLLIGDTASKIRCSNCCNNDLCNDHCLGDPVTTNSMNLAKTTHTYTTPKNATLSTSTLQTTTITTPTQSKPTSILSTVSIFCSNKTSPCPTNLDPICGSDKQFYLNSCEFNKAKCDDPSLTPQGIPYCTGQLTKAPTTKTTKTSILTTRLTSLTTKPSTVPYKNTYATKTTKHSLPIFTTMDPIVEVFCQQKDSIICSDSTDAVCGTNGVIYRNSCYLTKAYCTDHSIKTQNMSHCKGKGITSGLIRSTIIAHKHTTRPSTSSINHIPTVHTPNTTMPGPTSCYVCSGPPFICEQRYHAERCPDASQQYCMNDLTNNRDGTKTLNRRCATKAECESDWWRQTSDRAECTTFDTNTLHAYMFRCSFCCTTPLCNEKIVPINLYTE